MLDDLPEPSYRALLEVPQLDRVVASMGLARVGQSMVVVAIVLYNLSVYVLPALAAAGSYLSLVPRQMLTPIYVSMPDRPSAHQPAMLS